MLTFKLHVLHKGKGIVPPVVEVPVQEHPNVKRRNYKHYHEEVGPTHFCKVILAPKLEALPLPLDFTKHFPIVPMEFSPKTNTGCSWRVTMKVVDGTVTLHQGWATFAAVHQIWIGYMLIFKLLTPTNIKVIVFNEYGVEMLIKCKKHDHAFIVTA
ncbi:U-box domain-containing protein 4 [Hordeum vulgare]|nr:U-box domain-containing protein 4 [Hordeum vulgare]